jgi:hypothetical protein
MFESLRKYQVKIADNAPVNGGRIEELSVIACRLALLPFVTVGTALGVKERIRDRYFYPKSPAKWSRELPAKLTGGRQN